jgi:hypothetical protein
MEEQRQRQEEEQRRAQAASASETEPADTAAAVPTAAPTSDEAMLERALALSTETPVKRHRVRFVSVLSFTVSSVHQNYFPLRFHSSTSFDKNIFLHSERRDDAGLLQHD